MEDDFFFQKIKNRYPESIVSHHSFRGDQTVTVHREYLYRVVQFLRSDDDLRFNILIDLTAVDDYGRGYRFEVVYHFYSMEKNHRVRIKVPLMERDAVVDSLVPLWPCADWYEREVWDMFGIRFDGHPDLRRILLYEEFEGHPLRKDYPIDKRQPLIGPGSKEERTTKD